MLTSLPKFLLNEEQVNQFCQEGYLKLPNIVPQEVIQLLREAIERICVKDLNAPDISVIEVEGKGKFVAGIDTLCNKDEPVFVQLLGSPFLLSIAEAICGADFFPVQEFAVLKILGDKTPVMWHQDVTNKSIGQTIMLGIYLDAANDENGALRIIPESHKSDLPLCDLQKMPYRSIEMQAGDILIHDLMLVHSSGILNTFPKRRVIYYEFMSSSLANNEQIYPSEMINNRLSFIPLAIKEYVDAYPSAAFFNWQHPDKELFTEIRTLKSIFEVPLKLKPANYCFDFSS
jgi:ectoine hydroxylase-related dioxygenase (phytanoyl-CoA dioxygenase family)